MARYRSRPVEIEARQWDGTADGAGPILKWIHGLGGLASYTDPCAHDDGDAPHVIRIRTLEGVMDASPGDYVIRGTEGEFYPCKPSVVARKYERVN